MDAAIIAAIVSALASLAAGGLASLPFVRKSLRIEKAEESYSERLTRLTKSLNKSSREVGSVLKELAAVAQSRERAVQNLESELATLEQREQSIKERIEQLQNVPIPVADHFASLVESGEKRSARRDYMLFGAGVVVTSLIAIAIQLLLA